MINIKPCDFIFFQDLNPETTTIVFIFRGCDQNTKLDFRMSNFFKKKNKKKHSIFKYRSPQNQRKELLTQTL